MEETVTMNIEPRASTSKGANKLLRKNGYLPANIFGKGVESIAISIKKDVFRRSLKENGRNAVFKLVAPNDDTYTVMTNEIHIAPITNEVSHVDFQLVSLSERMKSNVAIKILGGEFLESKRLILNILVDSIPVYGLPHDIPHEIEIDVSNMKSGESIVFRDLKLPDGITSDFDSEQKIVSARVSKVQDVVASE